MGRLMAILAVAVLTMLTASAPPTVTGDPVGLWDEGQDAARRHVDGRHAELIAEINRLKEQLAAAEAALGDATGTIEAQRVTIQQQNSEIDGLNAEIVALKLRIQELEDQAPDPDPTPTEPTSGLWWTKPAAVERDPGRKIWAHYVPFPHGGLWTNEPMESDTCADAYLAIQGENGAHAAIGGMIRDAMHHRGPYPGAGTLWRRAAAADEIAAAVKYEIDGFFVDTTSVSTENGSHWPVARALLEAAADFPGFMINPMIDTNGGIRNSTDAAIATHLVRYLSLPSAGKLPDGRHIVGVFHASGNLTLWPASRFDNIANELLKLGYPVVFSGAFVNVSHIAAYPNFWAAGPWSAGPDPANLQGPMSGASTVRANGQVLMASLLGQNVRPREGRYDEARGLGALDASWDQILRESAVVGQPDPLIQIVTWNDYAEGSAFGPSRRNGDAIAAYSAWRSLEWKTGTLPEIKVDTVFVVHRNQLLNAIITGGQTKFMTQDTRRANRTTSADEVQVITLLTRPARVTVEIGGVPLTYDAPQGKHVRWVAARPGRVEVSLPGLSFASPIEIRSTSGNQDRGWVVGWSANPKQVFDPTPVG